MGSATARMFGVCGAGIFILTLTAGVPAQQAVPQAMTPTAAMEAAAADLAIQPPELRKHLRYLWLPAEKPDWPTLSFHCNSLSSEPEIVVPRVLPCGTVAAINLVDYGWKRETWEELAAFDVDFHIRVVSKAKVKTREGEVKEKDKIENLLAPWLPDNATKFLVEWTKSEVPVVRATFFLWQTSQQADRGKAGYYNFIGVSSEKEFEDAIGFDEKVLKRFPKTIREAVASSMVTLQPRRIERFPTVGGAYWRTSDVRLAKGNANPLQQLNGGLEVDAHELIANNPCGLHWYFLGNNKGEAQDVAPDFIASDATSSSNDRRVHVGISCVRCHGGSSGINDIDGWARGLFQRPLSLQSPDYVTAKRLQRLYFSQMEPVIDDDRRIYVRAVAKATGRAPKENAEAYGRMYAEYDSPVSLEKACGEVGVTKEQFIETLKRKAATTPDADIVIGSFLSEKPKSIPRVVWRDNYQTAVLMMREQRKEGE